MAGGKGQFRDFEFMSCAFFDLANDGVTMEFNNHEVVASVFGPALLSNGHGVYVKEDSRTHRGKAVNKSVDIGNSESIVVGTKAAIEGGECGMDKLREMAAITDRPVFLEQRFLGIECVGGATTFGD